MTLWFGPTWDAPVNDGRHVATPVGQLCLWCTEPIEDGDSGVIQPYLAEVGRPPTLVAQHRNCFLRSVLGSVGHLNGQCSCSGGNHGDPPGMTRRQAADVAAEAWLALRD